MEPHLRVSGGANERMRAVDCMQPAGVPEHQEDVVSCFVFVFLIACFVVKNE